MKKLRKLFVRYSAVKSLNAKKIFGFAVAGASLAVAGTQAHAQVIVSDDFTNAPSNNALIGTSPDGVNLPGGVWGYTGANDYDNRMASNSSYFSNYPDFASSRNGTGAAISVQSSGSYVEPDSLTISAEVNPFGPASQGTNGANTNSVPDPTAYLGFYSQTQSAHYQAGPATHLVGLSLTQNGVLDYIVDGTSIATGITNAAAFDSNGFAELSFTESYDSGSGYATISNIKLGGISYSNVYVADPSADPLAYAGFGGNSNGFAFGATFADFSVNGPESAVPEPSTYALLASGALLLGAHQLRRRRNQV